MDKSLLELTPDTGHDNGPQQPLRLSVGNWIAFAAVVGAGWLGAQLNDRDTDLPIESFHSDCVIVKRVAGETIQLPDFGIQITPTNGWSYLRRIGKPNKASRSTLTFANPKNSVIVTITAVSFKQWPPTFDRELGNPVNIPVESAYPRPPKIKTNLISTSYQHLGVDWYLDVRYPYASERQGRIDTGFQELLVKTTALPGIGESQADAVRQLCDQIEPY